MPETTLPPTLLSDTLLPALTCSWRLSHGCPSPFSEGPPVLCSWVTSLLRICSSVCWISRAVAQATAPKAAPQLNQRATESAGSRPRPPMSPGGPLGARKEGGEAGMSWGPCQQLWLQEWVARRCRQWCRREKGVTQGRNKKELENKKEGGGKQARTLLVLLALCCGASVVWDPRPPAWRACGAVSLGSSGLQWHPGGAAKPQEPWGGPTSGGGKVSWRWGMVPGAGMKGQAGQCAGSRDEGGSPSGSGLGEISGEVR